MIIKNNEINKTNMNVKSDHRSKFSNLSNWKEEAGKNQGFTSLHGKI